MTKLLASLAMLLLCAIAWWHSQAVVSLPEPRDKAYEPRFRPGVPILSRIQPDERVIEILKDAPPDLGITPDAEEAIEGLTRRSDAVAIVRVVDKRSAFTTESSPPHRVPGDWINSTVTATVLTVLKDPGTRLAEGGSVSFLEDGGELVVDGRRVIAGNAYELPTRVGETYLMFFWLNEDALQFLGPSWTFRVVGQKLQRLRTDFDPQRELDRKTLEWAELRVRAKAHLPRPEGAAQ